MALLRPGVTPVVKPVVRPRDMVALVNGGRLSSLLPALSRAATVVWWDSAGLTNFAAQVPIVDDVGQFVLEPTRTNSQEYSENVLLWDTSGANVTRTSSGSTAPDGGDSTRVQMPDDSGTFLRNGVSLSISTVYTYSIFMQADSAQQVIIDARDHLGGALAAKTVDITTEWQRFSLTFTADSGNSLHFCGMNNVGTMDVRVWGAQVETGSALSSYIETTGGAVTRTADTLSGDLWTGFKQGQGTLLWRGQIDHVGDGDTRFMSLSDGTANNRLTIQLLTSSMRFDVLSGGVSQASIAAPNGFTVGTEYKLGLTWQASQFIFAAGGASTTDSSGSVPGSLTTISFNENDAGYRTKQLIYSPTPVDAQYLENWTN